MSHPSRQSRWFVVLWLLPTLLLAQCGPADETPKPVDLAPTTVRWVTWDPNSGTEKVLVESFQERYPQIKFNRVGMNSSSASYLNETPPPDLVNMGVDYEFRQLISQDEVADLTELWTQAGLFDVIPPGIQTLGGRDGKQYYLPVAFGWQVIYYNKAIFAQYGLQPPATWEEFLLLCDTLLSQGEVPLSISGEFTQHYWFDYLNLRLNGPEFYRNLQAGKERYDDPRVGRVLETWRSLFAQGYFIEKPQTKADLSAVTAIIRGDNGKLSGERAVMVLTDAYSFGGLPTPFQAELDFFRFPTMDTAIPQAEIVSPFGYVVPLGADHAPAALAFLTDLASPAGQKIVAQTEMFPGVRYVPVRGDVNSDELTTQQRKVIELLKNATETVSPFYEGTPREMFGMLYFEFQQFVTGKQDIARFQEKFEAARQKMVEKGLLIVNE